MGKTRDLFKKTGDIKEIFNARMGMIKDRKFKDLTEAEEIKKKWQENTEKIYKKGLDDLDNNVVITYLELDILECEVKRVLGIITTNKANGGDGIPAELFQILNLTMLLKCCTQYISKFGKPSSSHRTRKGQFSSQFQRSSVLKNAQTTGQFCSLPMLVKLCSKSFKLVSAVLKSRTSRCTTLV